MSSSDIALQVLISGKRETLWLSSCQRELLRLLRHADQVFNKKQINTLTDAILDGPPRTLFREMPDQEWEELKSREILHRLKKLEVSGIELPAKAQKAIEKINKTHPDIGFREGDDFRDEFPYYMYSGWSDEFDYEEKRLTPDQIKEMPDDKFEEYALENQEWDEAWMNYCKALPDNAFLRLKSLADQKGKWPYHRWSSAFHGFRQLMTRSSEEHREYKFDKKFAEKVLKSISAMPLETLKAPQVSVEAAKFIDFRTFAGEAPDKLYWGVWEKLWDASLDIEITRSDLRTEALNTACGELAEQLIYHLSNLKPEKDTGLPKDLEKHANMVVEGTGQGALVGRVMLISRLSFFFNIAPDWSKEKLVPLLSKEENPDEWMQMWVGFMWSPRVYPNLFFAIKNAFFDLLDDIEAYAKTFEDDRHDEAKRIAQLLSYLCIPEETRITRDEAKKLLNKLSSKLLAEVALTLKNQLHGAGEDKAVNMWQKQVKPWFLAVWPKTIRAKDSRVSGALAEMCLNAEEDFPDCVETLINYLGPINPDDHRMVIFRLSEKSEKSKQSDIPSTYPKATLKLLHKLIDQRPTWYSDYLKGVLDVIAQAEPSVKSMKKYKDLRNITGV